MKTAEAEFNVGEIVRIIHENEARKCMICSINDDGTYDLFYERGKRL
jgi:hypothetical protein